MPTSNTAMETDNTDSDHSDIGARSIRDEVRDWLDRTLPAEWVNLVHRGRPPGSPTLYPEFDLDHWVTEFFDRRYLTSGWPKDFGGLGLPANEVVAVREELAKYEAPLPLYTTPIRMIGEAILRFGSAQQKKRFLPEMAGGQILCQLFSEPNAGSDLVSLRTRAEPHRDHWVVTGQKVWTSFAHLASHGALIARSDPTAELHRGITCFMLDMHTPGIDIRPLRQMSGDSAFNEVFLNEVVIPDEMRLGPINEGWSVVGCMLDAERGVLSSARIGGIDVFRLLARHEGTRDPHIRQMLTDAYIRFRVHQMSGLRGYGQGPEAPVMKLMQSENNKRLQELALSLEGPAGVAHMPEDTERAEIQYGFLRSRSNTIGGGTSEVMRNIISERVLGLQRERRPEN
jgi:3-oxochol-4-en-24-oyl-CoA dehydrogenase